MGMTAENLADQFKVTREEQDAYALDSQQKAGAAMEVERFAGEIVPVTVKHRKGETVVDKDEHPRPQTTLESLAKLRPAFKKDGSVTAGNASGINDGASSLLVVAADEAPSGVDTSNTVFLRDVRSHGCAPETMGLGPIQATRNLLAAAGLKIEDIGLWELSEAFAVQSIAVERELGMPTDRVNVNGGAIALGHPIGASGARLITSLIHEMKRRNECYGVAAMCIGGGQGIACLLENR
jgi:acetyl-CoA C-acetyltransferase